MDFEKWSLQNSQAFQNQISMDGINSPKKERKHVVAVKQRLCQQQKWKREKLLKFAFFLASHVPRYPSPTLLDRKSRGLKVNPTLLVAVPSTNAIDQKEQKH